MLRRTTARTLRAVFAGAVAWVTIASGPTLLAAPASADDGGGVQLNVEERRLSVPRPGGSTPYAAEAIAAGGFEPLLADFRNRLNGAAESEVSGLVDAGARGLWAHAVEQSRVALERNARDSGDDRGLYWARLQMRVDLKTWAADHSLAPSSIEQLLHTLEYASRGISDAAFDPTWTGRRVLLSGFDPFFLDWDIARPNPSGAVALSLDGAILHDAAGDVQVHTVMLPVNWTDFAAGIVEDAFGPALTPGAGSADMTMTVSQSGPGFDIERWAGAWRGGGPDNLNVDRRQLIPAASAWPATAEGAQFIETTLPADAMVRATTGPFSVKINELICTAPTPERNESDTTCTSPTDYVQPSPQAYAVEGGGGSYLSNESMYRVNRLRVGLGRDDIAGGHLHIPPIDTNDLETSRRTVIDQSIDLVRAAAAALPDIAAHLSVEKSTATRAAAANTTVTYQYVVTNTGTTTLSRVTLDDDEVSLSSIECDKPLPAALTPGARLTCASTRTITEDDVTRSVLAPGTATATGVTAKGRSATATATAASIAMIPSPASSTPEPTPVPESTATDEPTVGGSSIPSGQGDAAPSPSRLASTGAESVSAFVIAGVLAVLVGGAAVFAGARRRRTRVPMR